MPAVPGGGPRLPEDSCVRKGLPSPPAEMPARPRRPAALWQRPEARAAPGLPASARLPSVRVRAGVGLWCV